MAKSEAKTKVNDNSVTAFLEAVTDEKRREDCYVLLTLFQQLTGYEPKMWGSNIIGFGRYHYKYASGHQGDAAIVGFSPRKQNITLYLPTGLNEQPDRIAKLGKVKAGAGCLYIRWLEEIKKDILEELIQESVLVLSQRKDIKIIS